MPFSLSLFRLAFFLRKRSLTWPLTFEGRDGHRGAREGAAGPDGWMDRAGETGLAVVVLPIAGSRVGNRSLNANGVTVVYRALIYKLLTLMRSQKMSMIKGNANDIIKKLNE